MYNKLLEKFISKDKNYVYCVYSIYEYINNKTFIEVDEYFNKIINVRKHHMNKTFICVLYINSGGGILKDTFKICNKINKVKYEHNIVFITIGLENVCSGATLIHSLGDIKLITDKTEYIIHCPQTQVTTMITTNNKTFVNIKYIKFATYKKMMKCQIVKKMIDIYIFSRININKKQLKKIIKCGNTINYIDCLNYKFADSFILDANSYNINDIFDENKFLNI